MQIDNRIFEPYTMEFNSPLTDEDWEKIADVDFDHTEHIWFHTKHGKEVHFYKDAIPIDFIEDWLDKTTGTRDGEDISQLPEQLKFAIQMINLMEMDWRKENESIRI